METAIKNEYKEGVEMAHRSIKAVILYIYNEEVYPLFNLVYGPNMAPAYFDEKCESFWRDKLNWYMNLDEKKQKKIINASFMKIGETHQ